MKKYNLTTPQMNIWNLQKFYPNTAISNECGAIFCEEKRDRKKLEQAINMIIERQSGFRLRFIDNGETKQYVADYEPIEIPFMRFETEAELNRYASDFAKQSIGLEDEQQFRILIFEENEKSGVLVALSHLISDAWTFSLLASEVDKAYRVLIGELEADLFTSDYLEYVESEKKYFASTKYEQDREFWQNKYINRPEETFIKMNTSTSDSIEAKRLVVNLPEEVEAQIKEFCQSHSVTEAVLFETAMFLYLHQTNLEAESVTIGIPVLNRSSVKEKMTAGMFISTMPLTVSFEKNMTVDELAAQITKGHMNVFRHQKYPYAEILKSLREKQNFEGNLYHVMMSYQNATTGTGNRTCWYSNGYSEVPFVMHIDNRDGNCSHTITIDYQTAIFRQENEVCLILKRLFYILSQICKNSDMKVEDISIIPEQEKQAVLEAFNDTYIEYSKEKCVHELFAEQVKKIPNETALVCEDKKFTYKELDKMSNSLAHLLRENGVKRGDIVPIVAKRSWHVIVAMLGVLKAGAAYMPVSPEFPADRVKYMFEMANVKLALSYGIQNENSDLDYDVEMVSLEQIDYSKNVEAVSQENDVDDMSYIIFTSGSTGQPKGVAITHRNVSNYCHNNNNNNVCHKVVSDGNKKIVSVTNIVFDIFVTESLLPLLNGMTIYFANDEEVMSQEKLSKLITVNGVDVLQTTPTKMRSYLLNRDNLEYLNTLKTIILGGEALPEDLYREIGNHTRAKIFNIYGPAETTIWSTNKELKGEMWLVHELFERTVATNPDKIALIAQNERLTYRQLDEKSSALAKKLILLGIEKGDVIGAYLDRTSFTVISQLAVLKAGGVFLPIDHRYPKDRIDYMLQDCKVKLVVTDEDLSEAWDIEYFNLKEYKFDDVLIMSVNVTAEDPCYVIYTSGSTGKPKGCVLLHKGIANFCANNNIIPYAQSLEYQSVVSVNTISFDFFIAETLLPLAQGWTVVLASEEKSSDKEKFRRLVIENKVNIIETTPTRLELYTKDEEENGYFQQIQLVVSSGEALPEALLQKIRSISKAKIYNPLGPSECSVWNVDGDFKSEITIGKPIANTQIYILDKNQKLLPIGVAGELCIAGDGVGKGYLNRPDLTAEKFVPNPFATEENHHGKIMYHTGDLARWRADGEIEYLGRIDTQVKIRGLRIELGEIESVMSGFEGIQLTAVTDKKDENGRQYLVGYYTATEFIDEKELRKHLSAKLPKYMVPNYFMYLDKMPMTASGKTDRKNLPVPEFNHQNEEYIAPETEQEKILCEILQEILNMEKVGVNYDFFEYGGDSLGAITYVAQAHSQGIDMDLQYVFDYPTVRQLCEFLNSGKKARVVYETKDFEKYEEIFNQNVIDEKFVPDEKPLGNVLVTGATGFLGAHVVDQLMHETEGTIYCLVRSQKENDRIGRLAEILTYYFGDKYEDEIGKRIIPVIGDIEIEGLSTDAPAQVDTVIHTAASVKHYGSYSYFKKVNVEGTKHVVDYAKNAGARLIHVSTLSVSGNSLADDFSVYRSKEEKFFYESSFYIGQPLDNVYIRSKFEAEKCVYDAMLDGLDAKVVRVGNLTNRASDYMFQKNYKENAFLTRVKAVLEFGLFPEYLMPLYAEFSPIDKTAQGVLKIAQYAKKQTVFHLNNDRVIFFDRFLEVVQKLGISMKVVSGPIFNEELQKTMQSNATEYIFKAFQNDMDENGQLIYDSNIHIENEFTLWFLKQVGFEWNETDEEYIRGYIGYFHDLGYLEV